MFARSALLLLNIVGCLALGAGGATADPVVDKGQNTLWLPIGRQAPAPDGFAARPGRYDWDAVFGTADGPGSGPAGDPLSGHGPVESARIELIGTLRRTVEDLNIRANSRRRDDRGTRLDCVGYVKLKRAALMSAGVPAEALSAAVVLSAGGEAHAVLVLSTVSGDVVLDNLSPYIVPWRQTDYVWVEREIAGTRKAGSSGWAWVGPPPRVSNPQYASR